MKYKRIRIYIAVEIPIHEIPGIDTQPMKEQTKRFPFPAQQARRNTKIFTYPVGYDCCD